MFINSYFIAYIGIEQQPQLQARLTARVAAVAAAVAVAVAAAADIAAADIAAVDIAAVAAAVVAEIAAAAIAAAVAQLRPVLEAGRLVARKANAASALAAAPVGSAELRASHQKQPVASGSEQQMSQNLRFVCRHHCRLQYHSLPLVLPQNQIE